MTLLIIYLCAAIGFSFYCSVAEAVLLSITPSFIATLRDSKPADALRLARLKENIDRPLAAILSLNTIAHTIGAAGVGAQAAALWGSQSLAVVSALMTLLILIFSEIIPKTIGALYWRSLGPFVARTVGVLIWVLYPLVWLSEQLTKVLSGGKSHHTLTREELGAMAEIGAQQGVLGEDESRLFHSLMRFPQIRVTDIMTPRVVVIALDESLTVSRALELHPNLQVTRVPIYKSSLDHASGFVMRSDLLLAKSRGEGDKLLAELKRELTTVHDSMSAKAALDALLKNRQHIALVTDQYGSAVGIVTLEDVIETLLGLEIVDEHDTQVDMQKYARQRWKTRAKKIGLEVESDDQA
ncbi:hemolysin family protein [Stieleria sp. TO1_6]|uniref:CNNM domain-containing protein n=1 Tax=Stieleria tagensis TaxID=2956795 RepID=UPI00209B837B|nr:hemolysin family protein [Stieleria tagensis]MCO8124699.1 hemolysin family protein [Stieleria tagensis]